MSTTRRFSRRIGAEKRTRYGYGVFVGSIVQRICRMVCLVWVVGSLIPTARGLSIDPSTDDVADTNLSNPKVLPHAHPAVVASANEAATKDDATDGPLPMLEPPSVSSSNAAEIAPFEPPLLPTLDEIPPKNVGRNASSTPLGSRKAETMDSIPVPGAPTAGESMNGHSMSSPAGRSMDAPLPPIQNSNSETNALPTATTRVPAAGTVVPSRPETITDSKPPIPAAMQPIARTSSQPSDATKSPAIGNVVENPRDRTAARAMTSDGPDSAVRSVSPGKTADPANSVSAEVVATAKPVDSATGFRSGTAGEALAVLDREPIATTSNESGAEVPPGVDSATAIIAPEPEWIAMGPQSNRYVVVGSSPIGQTGYRSSVSLVDRSVHVVAGAGESASYTALKTEPTATSGAKLIEYDVRVYLALDGDTFEQISQTMFGTASFATALADYNRSRLGSNGVIPVGARVRIPPRWVLEGRDPPAASPRESFRRVDVPSPERAVQTDPSVASSTEGSSFGLVSKSNPSQPANAFEPSLTTSAEALGGAVYRAKEDETLWSVAAKTLGDGRRWREIHALNTDRLTSEVHVPAGTVLRLPDDARPRN